MTAENSGSSAAEGLRQRAEEKLKARQGANPESLSPEETITTLHELQVHQIELEMQNEELRRAQTELAAVKERYFDLYDLAPVGYLTLNEKGLIVTANLTASILMGVTRSALVTQPLSHFIIREEEDTYYLHLRALLTTGVQQSMEMRMLRADGSSFWGHLQATLTQDGECRVTLTDITERKRIEEVQVFLAQTSSGIQDEPFFEVLARYLSIILHMDFVCIDRLDKVGLTARTVAVWRDGHFEDNVTYALKGIPCGDVVGKTVCCFPANVCQFFPHDQVLKDLRAESYAGVTLWSHSGEPIGLITVIGHQMLTNQSLVESILKLVAIRAAVELERLGTDEMLRERIKELDCLYAIADLGENEDTLEKILQGTVELMPRSWLHDKIACARIVLGEQEFTTSNFHETAWRQTADIVLAGKQVGMVEIVYLEERPLRDEGPFLKEERSLINAIAERLGRVAEHKRAKAKLLVQAELHRIILQTAMDGFWLFDSHGCLLEVNEAYCRMSGYSVQELLAMRITDLEAVAVVGDTTAQIQQMMAQGEDRFVSRHRRKDGSIFDVEGSVQYRHTEGGLFVCFLQDITDRKLAEMALKNAHDGLERRVQERTADLGAAYEILNREFEDRKRRGEIFRVGLLVSEFAGTHSLDELLKKALGEIERLTGSRIGFFHFLEEDQQTLVLQTWSASTLSSFCSAGGKNQHYNVDEAGVWVDCIRQRRPVIHNDYAGLPHRKGLPPGHAEIVRQLVMPIVRGDKIVAILGIGNKEQDYDAQDIETVTDLANMTYDAVLRKKAEEQMFDSITTLNTVIDGISDPLIMLDAELRIKRLNKAARDYYGLNSYQDALGKHCFEAFRKRSSPCEVCDCPFSTMDGYYGSYERKGELDPRKIEQVFVDLVQDGSGKPQASIIRIHDITQAKIIDRQLIQSEKLSALGLLIAGIAHEINNPNNFIFFNTPILRSYLQFLLPFADEYAAAHPETLAFGRPYLIFREDCFKLLDNIEHGSTRINQIVGNLREFVSERGKGLRRWIDLKQIVEKGISICLGRIKKTIKTFETFIPEDLPVIFTDPLAVEQVMVNLLINAMQAVDKDDSWVRLRIIAPKEGDGELVLEVSDNGCGMDAATQRKIFDPFFTTKEVGVGTGLGLSISHRLVEDIEGRIEVESEAGKGATFRVFLKSTPPVEHRSEDELTC